MAKSLGDQIQAKKFSLAQIKQKRHTMMCKKIIWQHYIGPMMLARGVSWKVADPSFAQMVVTSRQDIRATCL
jgi:hypothetical protein